VCVFYLAQLEAVLDEVRRILDCNCNDKQDIGKINCIFACTCHFAEKSVLPAIRVADDAETLVGDDWWVEREVAAEATEAASMDLRPRTPPSVTTSTVGPSKQAAMRTRSLQQLRPRTPSATTSDKRRRSLVAAMISIASTHWRSWTSGPGLHRQ